MRIALWCFRRMNQGRKNDSASPFFITLMVNDLLLRNCMLDFEASTNAMSLKVMNQLGLKTTRPSSEIKVWSNQKIFKLNW